MKKMNKNIGLFLLLLMAFSACLQAGLEELPAFSDAEITRMRFEYRWINEEGDYPQLNVAPLDTEVSVDSENAVISCSITVPQANQDFPESIRDQVGLSGIVGFADISNAAVLSQLHGAPLLGEVADFSNGPYQYRVTAADGSGKEWTLVIDSFEK
ncbi:hypothetical protein GCM10028791_12850 [Echinicola sediminis]